MLGGGSGYYIKEFIGFIRPKISLFITGIGISGYLLFNSFDVKIIYVAFVSFFAAVAAYAYNQLTDKKEDLLNKEKLNFFVINRYYGYSIVITFVFLSFGLVLFLSELSLIFYILFFSAGLAYSGFRVKEIFPLKNVYTAFIMPTPFLVGAVANSPLTPEIIISFLLIVLLVLAISFLGDLRDYIGDKASGIKTLPVILGYYTVKKLAFIVLSSFFAGVIILNFKVFYFLLPFILGALLFLSKNDLKNTRTCILVSFIFLPFVLILLQNVGGI